MSYWIITGREGCPVAKRVTQVVSQEETDHQSGEEGPLYRWVVEACEGQIQRLAADPHVVRITWERR